MILSSYLSTFVSGGSLFFTTNGSAEEKYLTYLFPLGYINVTPFSPSFTSVPFGIWKKLLTQQIYAVIHSYGTAILLSLIIPGQTLNNFTALFYRLRRLSDIFTRI